MTTEHRLQILHPLCQGVPRRPDQSARHLCGIPGSLGRLANLMKLRAADIERALGNFGRTVHPNACAPHQRRQIVPLPRP
jgi:hypothetical protein